MNYLSVEINHRSLSLDKLQEIIPTNKAIDEIYTALYAPDNEVFILKTCFRFLIFSRNICKLTLDKILELHHINNGVTILSDHAAIERLFFIAGGLDSPFLGEGEIMAQFKNSFEQAQQKMALGPYLHQILKTALFTGKKIRTETDLGSTSSAYGSIAAQLCKQHITNFKDRQILILGTGTLAQQLYNYFSKKTNTPINISSACEKRAASFCENKNATIYPIENVGFANFDLIFAASNNISKTKLKSKSNQIIVDFGMPANLQYTGEGNYYNMSDIKALQESKNQTKKAALNEANEIIIQEMKALEFWLRSRKVVPLIKDFKKRAEDIKQEEWEWAKPRLGMLSESQKAVLEKMMNRLVNRLTKQPVAKIKDFAQSEQTESNIKTFKEIFDL